jgi:hypothetical protein
MEDLPMEKKIQLNLYLPEHYRNLLQRIAGKRMLEDPKRSVTASKIAAEVLCDYLDRLEGKESTHDETGGGKEPE